MYIRDWNEHFKVNKWEYKRKDKIKKKKKKGQITLCPPVVCPKNILPIWGLKIDI